MEENSDHSSRPYPPARAGWYAVSVLLFAYIFSFIDRQILSLLVVPIQEDLHISDTQIGALFGLTFALFYSGPGLLIAWVIDRTSHRGRIIAIGVALWSIATAASGLATRYAYLFLARTGVAVGEAALLPGASSIIADYFEPKRRALAAGVFASGLYIGAGLAFIAGGVLVSALLDVHVTLPLFGTIGSWQLVFMIVGLPGLLIALLVLTIKEPPRHGVDPAKKGVPIPEVTRYFKAHQRAYWYFIIGAGMAVFVGQASGLWVPKFFLKVHGWDYTEIGLKMGLIILLLGAVGTIAGGWIADWFVARGMTDGKVRVCFAASGLLVIPAALFPMIANADLAIFVYSFTILIASGIWGAAPAAILDMTPGPMRGQMTAVYGGLINFMGLGLGPPFVGFLNDRVFTEVSEMKYSLIVAAVFGTTISATFFWLSLKHYRKAVAHAESWRPVSAS